MRIRIWVLLVALVVSLVPVGMLRAEQGVSVGYGFAAFMADKHVGKVEGGKYYDYLRVAYLYERPFVQKNLALLVEPFASYVNRPNDGVDGGLGLGLKYYPFRSENNGFFLSGGPGIMYTSIGFKEQGTHFLFILQGGLGYRHKKFFVENRVVHTSNGGTASPNWSVNSNILFLGMYF